LLSQASREEVKAIKPKLLEADSALLLGLSSYYRGLAEVEAVDFDEPDAERLKSAVPHFDEAREHLDASLKAGSAVLEMVREMQNSAGFRARLNAVAEDVKNFDKAIVPLRESAAKGAYPKARDCAAAAAAVVKVVSPMERNALVELGAHEADE